MESETKTKIFYYKKSKNGSTLYYNSEYKKIPLWKLPDKTQLHEFPTERLDDEKRQRKLAKLKRREEHVKIQLAKIQFEINELEPKQEYPRVDKKFAREQTFKPKPKPKPRPKLNTYTYTSSFFGDDVEGPSEDEIFLKKYGVINASTWRKWCLQNHPDKNKNADPELFMELNERVQILKRKGKF